MILCVKRSLDYTLTNILFKRGIIQNIPCPFRHRFEKQAIIINLIHHIHIRALNDNPDML